MSGLCATCTSGSGRVGNEVGHKILKVIEVDVGQVDLDRRWAMIDENTVFDGYGCPDLFGLLLEGFPYGIG